MYPDLGVDVELGTFQYEGSDETYYYAKNAAGKEFTVSRRLWKALLKADGTAPLDLPNGGKELLPKLKKLGLVRTSRFVRGGLFNRFVLFVFKRESRPMKTKFFKVADALLPLAAFAALFVGAGCMFLRGSLPRGEINYLLYLVWFLLSMVLHEAGHMIAGLAHGYRIREAGLLFVKVIPFGAYVGFEDRRKEPRWGKLRLNLSGIEVNLILAGIFYAIASAGGALAPTTCEIAYTNVLLAVFNLFPLAALDGEGVLSALCGVDSIHRLARRTLFCAKTRKKLLRSGLLGIGTFLFLGAVLLARVFLFLLTVVLIILGVCSNV